MTNHWHVTKKQAIAFLGAPPSTVYAWMARGVLPTARVEGVELVPLAELQRLKWELEDWGRLLTASQAGELIGAAPNTIRQHAKAGILRAQKREGVYGFRREDVIDYWRGYMRGACLRCGILGEAEPDRGFMCKPCEYEHRTGRIYRYPCCPPARTRNLLRGRLALQQGGNGGATY